jgi:hypothetical protein
MSNNQQAKETEKFQAWEKGGQHAQILYQMLLNGTSTIPMDWKPTHIVAEFPQYAVYMPSNFRSTVNRYKRNIRAMNDDDRTTLFIDTIELNPVLSTTVTPRSSK